VIPVTIVVNSPAPASQLQRTLAIQDRMQADARQAVMSSGHWLGVAEVATLSPCTRAKASARTIQWERQGRILAIETEQGHLFPDYGFDPDNGYRPRDLPPSAVPFITRKSGVSRLIDLDGG
jgi:hypothetical protein